MNPILKLAQQIKDAEGITLAAVIEKVEKIRVDEEMSQKDIKKLAQALLTLKKTVDDIPLDTEVKRLKTAISDATARVTESLGGKIEAVRNELKATEVRLLEEMVSRIPDIVTVTEKVTEVAKELDEQEQKKVLDKVLDPEFVAKVRDVIESFEADERLDASKLKNLPEMQTLQMGGGGGSNLTVYKDGVQVNSSTRLNFAGSGVAVTTEAGGTKVTITGGGGYTNLTEFVDQTPHRVFYSNASGDVTELALGADGTFLKSNGATSAPSFATPAGSGDVTKVGTPVNNQVGVWTGDGTLEGDTALTFDTTTDTLATGIVTVTDDAYAAGWNGSTAVPTKNAVYDKIEAITHDAVTVSDSSEIDFTLTGQQITASLIAGSIDETKLDVSVNASLDLADSAVQENDSPSFGTVTATVEVVSPELRASSSAGVLIEANNGTDVSLLGVGNTANVTHYGVHQFPTGGVQIGSSVPFADTAGTLTLQNIDVLDATTEATIEAAIDTLANLTSIQGRTVTLADAGANAIFGWDDVAGAYENLTQSEVKAIIGTASDTATGVVELAIGSEVTTGTDATRAITPDALAGSEPGKRTVAILVSGSASGDTALTTGDDKAAFPIDTTLNGMNLVAVKAYVSTVSSSGAPLFQVRRSRRSSATARTVVDMLSTGVSIDASEFESADAASAVSINTSNDDVQTGDFLIIDCDTAGTGVKGAQILLTFQTP